MDMELEKKPTPRGLRDGVYSEDSGLPPPKDIDGGSVTKPKPKKMAAGGSVGSASKRADGIAQRGKTRGRMC